MGEDLKGEYTNVKDFAKALDVSRGTVLNWIRSGDVKAYRVGNRWRIPTAEIDRMKNDDGTSSESLIILPTKEELEAFWKEQNALDDWMQSLTDEQLKHLADSGLYNNAMKGYAVRAAQEMQLDKEQTAELLRCFGYALDMLNKEDAERLYASYCDGDLFSDD